MIENDNEFYFLRQDQVNININCEIKKNPQAKTNHNILIPL